MGGQEIGLRLAEVHPGSSAQTTPNGSYLNDGSTLERENEDLKVMSQLFDDINDCTTGWQISKMWLAKASSM